MENEVVGIVCHDAGGGEVISSYCKKWKKNYIFYLEGPSIRIFKRKLSVESEKNLQDLVFKSDHLILGTSGRSDLEIEAIKLATEHNPDLAILDVKMPELDGISAAEKIIEIAPVLMLTAFSQKELVDRARDAGVMAYVVKPFTIGDLTPAIEIAISRHSQMKALKEEVTDLHDRLETRKIIDRAKGILMQALNLSEPEAFSWIQRAAMDRRISMKAVAQAVISPDSVPDK